MAAGEKPGRSPTDCSSSDSDTKPNSLGKLSTELPLECSTIPDFPDSLSLLLLSPNWGRANSAISCKWSPRCFSRVWRVKFNPQSGQTTLVTSALSHLLITASNCPLFTCSECLALICSWNSVFCENDFEQASQYHSLQWSCTSWLNHCRWLSYNLSAFGQSRNVQT